MGKKIAVVIASLALAGASIFGFAHNAEAKANSVKANSVKVVDTAKSV